MAPEKRVEKDRLILDKNVENTRKQLRMMTKDFEDLREQCLRVSQPNYIDHLEKQIADVQD